MKVIIRRKTFETNSSSTHSLNIVTQQQWDDWKEGKYLAEWDGDLYLVDDLIEKVKNDFAKHPAWFDEGFDPENREACIKYLTKNNGEYYTYEEWGSYDEWSDWAEVFDKSYTTPSGDKIHIYGCYGYDS